MYNNVNNVFHQISRDQIQQMLLESNSDQAAMSPVGMKHRLYTIQGRVQVYCPDTNVSLWDLDTPKESNEDAIVHMSGLYVRPVVLR